MAVDMFLHLDGIKGESADKVHKGSVDVLAWSWGLSNSGSAHMGAGQGAGKANFQDISFTKYIDLSSATLQLSCANGKHIKSGKLVVRKAGENPLEYFLVNFEDILISSISTGGGKGEERLTENVTLNFAKVKVTYASQNEKGGKGDSAEWGWDIRANAKQ